MAGKCWSMDCVIHPQLRTRADRNPYYPWPTDEKPKVREMSWLTYLRVSRELRQPDPLSPLLVSVARVKKQHFVHMSWKESSKNMLQQWKIKKNVQNLGKSCENYKGTFKSPNNSSISKSKTLLTKRVGRKYELNLAEQQRTKGYYFIFKMLTNRRYRLGCFLKCNYCCYEAGV